MQNLNTIYEITKKAINVAKKYNQIIVNNKDEVYVTPIQFPCLCGFIDGTCSIILAKEFELYKMLDGNISITILK